MRVRDVAEQTAKTLGTDAEAEAQRLRRWLALGVPIPAGREGSAAQSPYVFPQAAPAVAAILAHLNDAWGVSAPSVLRSLWAKLAAPGAKGESAPIDLILASVREGAETHLVLTHFERDGGRPNLHVAWRIFGDDAPIACPADAEPVSWATIDLRELLRRFVTAPADAN